MSTQAQTTEAQTFEAQAGRLDAVLAALCGSSRSQVAHWIGAGAVQVDGLTALKSGLKLRGGETLSVTVPPPVEAYVRPEQVALDILFEDECLIAVNKPPGMATHPGPGLSSGTLVNALLARMSLPEQPDSAGPDGYRPGIVHRLDKDTSGVIVVAKTVEAHAKLAAAFKERETRKVYLALIAGRWGAERPLSLDAPIGRHLRERQRMSVNGAAAREAQTRFVPLAHFGREGRVYACVRAEPRTGRTHQIRVHLAQLGSPVLGDTTYGRPSEVISRQALHAWQLTLPHPLTGEPLSLTAPPPDDLLMAWSALGGQLPDALLPQEQATES